jgi:PAS domain S-box-containing protein
MSSIPAHILLVEDNPGDARLLRELLAEADHERFSMTHVDRLAAGISCVRKGGIDLVLLDLSLPDSQGFEPLDRMHAESAGIPIVVMTGIEDDALALQLIQHGAQDYLLKGRVTGPLLQRSLRYAIERARMANELRDKQRLLQSVLDSVADGVVMADETGEFKVWNPAASRIVGSGPTPLKIDEWTSHYGLFLPDTVTPYPPRALPLVKAIQGESTNDELIFIRNGPHSHEAWLSVNARPLRDETGRITGGVAVFRNITQRRLTEDALRETQEQYRLLVTKANDIIYRTDAMGRFTFVNPVAARIMKYSEQELLGRRFVELIHPDYREQAEQFYGRQFVRRRSSTYYEFLARTKDGTDVWIGQNVQVLQEEGRVIGFQAVARDITERKHAEEARLESEERLRSIVHSTDNAIIVMNTEGEVVFWNSAAETCFGYAAEEMIGREVTRIIPERFREAHREGVRRVAAAGRLTMHGSMFELIGLRKDGTEFPLEFSLAGWTAKSTLFITAIIRDITERKRAEGERQQLARDRLLLLDSTGDGIYGLGLDGRCTFINKAGAQMLGYRPEELMGQDMHRLIHHSFPDGAAYPPAECRVYRAFQNGQSCHVDHEVFWRKGGTSFPVSYSSFPVFEQEAITGAVVIFVDNTERRRLEEDRSRRATRLVKQQTALTALTQSRLFQSSELMPTLRHISAIAARTLGIERVSIWRFTDNRTSLQCIDLFELSHERHSAGMSLSVTSFPSYFAALASSPIIAADDVHADERTRELSSSFLSPACINSMMDVPIYFFGRLEGVICHEHVGPLRHWSEDEQMFAVAMSNLVTLAYEQGERRRAEEQLQQSQERLRSLTGRVESVQEEERTRISREVHDKLGQELTGVKLELAFLRDQLAHSGPDVLSRIETITKQVDQTMQSVRKIATELRPVVLDQLGLLPAIEWQAGDFQAKTGITCTLNFYLRTVAMSIDRSTGVFRIFQEILTNVARHAKASQLNISVQEHKGHLLLLVSDNGRGITDEEVSGSKSLGLLGMRERALLLGGETKIERNPDKGTIVTVRIPMDPPEPDPCDDAGEASGQA